MAAGAAPPDAARPPVADLFADGAVHAIRIEVPPADVESLRHRPRTAVTATLRWGPERYRKVRLHLKGATGSFRSVDDKPGLTLSFRPDQPCHGLRKIHLNNSVEDPSLLNEQLGSELFRAAGVPAPRIAHARVEFNGRPLGLYVLKEGFTTDFLASAFGRSDGNLYEPVEGSDVDGVMQRQAGPDRPTDPADLHALAEAAAEADVERRWQRLNEQLDAERFLTFMALEVMLGHRDGYCMARNNFRIYDNPDTDRWVFLPHGMDQLFGKADLPWRPHMAGLVARAILETPEGRLRYRARFGVLFERHFPVASVPRLSQRVDELLTALRPALTRREFVPVAQAAELVKERIARRAESLRSQLAEPESGPLAFKDRRARLTGWSAVDASSAGSMERTRSPDGVEALHIRAGPRTAASWRARVLLMRGQYRFEGRARLSAVKPLGSWSPQGAGLRVGGRDRRADSFIGESAWRVLATEFRVDAIAEEVELVCELRASAGDAWFDAASLQLVRVE